MSENVSDAGRFLKEAEDYFYALARARGLGLAVGTWNHPRYGMLRVRAVFGQIGNLYVTLVFCATDAWLAISQGRIWWYLNDQADPFEFKHVATRAPMAEVIINAECDLEAEIGDRIRWLESVKSIEAAVTGIFGKALENLAKVDEARNDVRVALAEEVPKGDEEDSE